MVNRFRNAGLLVVFASLGFFDHAPGAEVREGSGVVFARVAGAKIALPDAKVTFEWIPWWTLAHTETGPDGTFRVPLRADSGRLCARATGFESACVAVTPPPTGAPLSEVRAELVLERASGVLAGRVTGKDGIGCFRAPSRFGTGVRAEVELRGGFFGLTIAKAKANHLGEYVLGSVPIGVYDGVARCGEESVTKRLTVGLSDIDGDPRVDFEIVNLPPQIELLFARDASGQARRTASPGETLSVVVRAIDPDGDTLRYRFIDQNGASLPPQGAGTTWTLSTEPVRNLLSVEVSDGRGGFVEEVLELPTSAAGALFSGRLLSDSGLPLAGARIQVNDATTVTDALGAFRLTVPEDNRYVLTVAEEGHALLSRVFDASAVGIDLTLIAPTAVVVDPDQDFVLSDPTGRVTIAVPADSLIEADGDSASGPVSVFFHAYGAESPPPGDGSVLFADGASALGEVEGSFFVEFRTATGAPLTLDDDTEATALVRVDRLFAASLPDTLTVGSYEAGAWRTLDTATKDLELSTTESVLYRIPLIADTTAILSVLSSKTCARIRADRESVLVPMRVTVNRHVGETDGVPQYVFERELLIPDYEYHALELKPNAFYQLIAASEGLTGAPFNGPPIVRYFGSGAPNFFGSETYPYETCQERSSLLSRRLPPRPMFLTRGATGGPTPTQYYDAIGATTSKATIEQWKAANGFNTKTVLSARFYNKNELGLGREIHCVTGPLACYIRKYGKAGGPIDGALDDMALGLNGTDFVAIDTLPNSPGIGFYSYGPDGKLKPSTFFDSQGEKDMPGVCIGCHGGKFVDNLGRVPAYFVPVDPGAHVYSEGASQEIHRSINRMNDAVALSKHTTTSIHNYIRELYRQPSYCNPGSTCPPDSGIECPPPEPPPDPLPPECTDPSLFPYVGDPPSSYQSKAGGPEVFDKVIHPFCVLCHMSRDQLDWSNADLLLSRATTVRNAICDAHIMPHAFVPFRNFWQGQDAVNQLMDFLKQPRCPPYVPVVSIQDQFPPTATQIPVVPIPH